MLKKVSLNTLEKRLKLHEKELLEDFQGNGLIFRDKPGEYTFFNRRFEEFVREWDMDASKAAGTETVDFDKDDFINKLQRVEENVELSEKTGYKVIKTHVLPRESWIEGYYDILRSRAQALKDHEDASIREFAEGTLREIEAFEISEDSYNYVFLVLQRSWQSALTTRT